MKPYLDWRNLVARGNGGRAGIYLSIMISLGSCATTPTPSRTPSGIAPNQTVTVSVHWVKVRSDPPTWYPRGTRSDCPTDFRSGEWVETGDHEGTRYFIPLHVSGTISRKLLVNEALAARRTDAHGPSTTDGCRNLANTVGNIIVAPPLLIMSLYGAKYGPQEKFSVDKKTFVPFGH